MKQKCVELSHQLVIVSLSHYDKFRGDASIQILGSYIKEFYDFPSRQINDPWLVKRYSLLFLPATPSSPSRTLEGLFELTRRPSQALDSPRALLPELQRYKDTVRCGLLGTEIPGHRQQQLTQTLIVRL